MRRSLKPSQLVPDGFLVDHLDVGADRISLIARSAAIRALSQAGVPIRQIVRRLGHSRKVVREVLRGTVAAVEQGVPALVEAHKVVAAFQAAVCTGTALVERADGRPGHQDEARQTPDLRTRQDRSIADPPNRRQSVIIGSRIAPEPMFQAELNRNIFA